MKAETFTLFRQKDNGPWIIPTCMHQQQRHEILVGMLDLLERSATFNAQGIANLKRDGDTLSYDRTLNQAAVGFLPAFRPCTMTWRILSEEALAVAVKAGAKIEKGKDY